MIIDYVKLDSCLNKLINDLEAARKAALVITGERLGLFKAMVELGPVTPGELAEQTGTTERYACNWLEAQTAAGYVTYESSTKCFELPREQAMLFAIEDSPVFMQGTFEALRLMFEDEPICDEVRRARLERIVF